MPDDRTVRLRAAARREGLRNRRIEPERPLAPGSFVVLGTGQAGEIVRLASDLVRRLGAV